MSNLVGLGPTVAQSVARGHLGTFRTAQRWRICSSLLGGACLVVYGLAFNTDRELSASIIASGLLFPFACGLALWPDFQAGKGDFRRNAIFLGIFHGLSYSGMIVALLFANTGLVALVVTMLCIQSVVNVVIVSKILRGIPRTLTAESGAITYGLQTSLYAISNVVGNHIDKLLLYYCLSPASLAVYSISERIPEILKNYIKSTRIVLVREFARKEYFTPELNKKLYITGCLISAGILMVIVFAVPWLLPLAFTDTYRDSVLYCQLLCGTLVLGQVAQTRKTFLDSRLDAKANRNVTLGSNAIRICASLVFVPFLGILGAVIATAVYRFSTGLFVSRAVRRYRSPDALLGE